jgi:hypothetical protein
VEKAAKGVTPEIITEEIVATTEEIVAEAKEEVKEATAEVVDKLLTENGPQQLVSLRETVSSEGYDDKRGWRRIVALLGSTNSPFCR